jgi:hypothetical protein
MDVKYLLAAGALALAFVACDNTTSANTEGDAMIGQKSAVTENNDSSPKSYSSKDKISSSSTTKNSSSEDIPSDWNEDEYDDILQYDELSAIFSTQCTGEISDDHWYAYVKEIQDDIESVGTVDVTIDGSTMTTVIEGSVDMGSAELCAFLEEITKSDSEEPSDNDEAFGPAVEEDYGCDGAILKIKEKRIKTNINANDRELAYEESIVKCKSY